MGLRRKGQGFLPTHLGQVLHTRQLHETAFGESLRFLCSPLLSINEPNMIRGRFCAPYAFSKYVFLVTNEHVHMNQLLDGQN